MPRSTGKLCLVFFMKVAILTAKKFLRPCRTGCLDNAMQIGIISDTHLKGVTKEFEEIYDEYLSDKDLILHAGDVVSLEIIDFLSSKDFHGVCGNMDSLEVRRRLPKKKVIDLCGFTIGITHGWGSPAGLEDRILPLFPDVDVIIYGHSHVATNHVREGILFLNPGTATGFSSSKVHSIALLELTETIHGKTIIL